MLIAVFIGLIFAGIIAWNAVIAWYLKRYILEDDRIHHFMNGVFLTGNAIFIFAAILFFFFVPWQELSIQSMQSYFTELLRGFMP